MESLSQTAIQKILGIKEEVCLLPEEMARRLTVTFYPSEKHKVSKNILDFAEKLKVAFNDLGVKIIPYEESLATPKLKRRMKLFFYLLLGKLPPELKRGKKIREGITVISLGEGVAGNLAMDNTMSFARNTVITILDMPEGVNSQTEFHKHFDIAMNLFTYHMTNIAIVVNDKDWIPYNFNASHPTYSLQGDFNKDILKGLVPKIFAPIKPPKLKEFTILDQQFDPFDEKHKSIVDDFLNSGSTLERTGLYPPGKSLEDLPFRNNFYKWIGQLHLDFRNGMSYGFLARQMPVKYGKVYNFENLKTDPGWIISDTKDIFDHEGSEYLLFEIADRKFLVEVPEVWVVTQRSGSKKTDIDPAKDLLKMGLKNGKMFLQTPKGLRMTPDYKPSFDTKVILAHAVGNAILGSVLKHLGTDLEFSSHLESEGMALAHWHGYINPDEIPDGWNVYGLENVPVSCSTYQSAIYALDGKVRAFLKSKAQNKKYLGDIHIEPHHGTNITHFTLRSLSEFLTQKQDVTNLGNYYLNKYK